MKRLRIYVDTSVIGGCFDEEFAEESRALVQLAKNGKIVMILSNITLDEASRAPHHVQKEIDLIPDEYSETLLESFESQSLCNAYLEAGAITQKHIDDAHHVALATVSKADLLVSWNFKHIVHLEKIRMFNAVNLKEGYQPIEIRTPKEVI